jgi:hypothetical protein
MWVNIVRWRVPKEKNKEQLEVWREMIDYQRSHPETVSLLRSRFFTCTDEGSSEENWMFLDEYRSREDFERFVKMWDEVPKLAKLGEEFFGKWEKVMTPKSRKREYWTEVEELRSGPLS